MLFNLKLLYVCWINSIGQSVFYRKRVIRDKGYIKYPIFCSFIYKLTCVPAVEIKMFPKVAYVSYCLKNLISCKNRAYP